MEEYSLMKCCSMKTRLFASMLFLAWSAGGRAPTFDTVKLDLLFERLLERNKGMGGLTLARDGERLFIQPAGEGRVPLEATAESTFRIAPGVTVDFDAAKGQMTMKRPQGERVFTKEK
jgi:hypothetical protein